jgi:uncharacterized protein (TIGR02246 family)
MADDHAAKAEIEKLIAALQRAWNAHDFTGYAACFHEDADFTNVFGLRRKGRAEIEASHQTATFLNMFKDSRYVPTETRVRFIRPDVAQVDVAWEMTGSRDPVGNAVPKRYGLLNLVATREASATGAATWLLKVFHNQDLPPPERAAEIARVLRS